MHFFSRLICLILLSLSVLFAAEPEATSKRIDFINHALGYLGTPYRYGGQSTKGMDCSGFICCCASDNLELQLPRRSDAIAQYATKIADSEIQPGDLLFFNTTNRISHVGIYIGAGKFVHSASDGPKKGVIVSRIQERYWKKTYRFTGRIMEPESIFTTEAAVPLLLRTNENSSLHPAIRLNAPASKEAPAKPQTK